MCSIGTPRPPPYPMKVTTTGSGSIQHNARRAQVPTPDAVAVRPGELDVADRRGAVGVGAWRSSVERGSDRPGLVQPLRAHLVAARRVQAVGDAVGQQLLGGEVEQRLGGLLVGLVRRQER